MLTMLTAAAFIAGAGLSAQPAPPAMMDVRHEALSTVLFRDLPFPHTVELVLRTIDPATGELGGWDITVDSTPYASGRGRLNARDTGAVSHYLGIDLPAGSYAIVARRELLPTPDGRRLVSTVCYSDGARIFTIGGHEVHLVDAPMTMTADPAAMAAQVEDVVAASAERQAQDLDRARAAHPDIRRAPTPLAITEEVRFRVGRDFGEDGRCPRGAVKGKIHPFTPPGQ